MRIDLSFGTIFVFTEEDVNCRLSLQASKVFRDFKDEDENKKRIINFARKIPASFESLIKSGKIQLLDNSKIPEYYWININKLFISFSVLANKTIIHKITNTKKDLYR